MRLFGGEARSLITSVARSASVRTFALSVRLVFFFAGTFQNFSFFSLNFFSFFSEDMFITDTDRKSWANFRRIVVFKCIQRDSTMTFTKYLLETPRKFFSIILILFQMFNRKCKINKELFSEFMNKEMRSLWS